MSAQMKPWAASHGAVDRPPTAAAARVRVGISVSRQRARRAVDRNTVKRVLREAARHASAKLLAAAPVGERVDIVLRLKASLPDREVATRVAVKAQLRSEADSLMAQLLQALERSGFGLAQRGGALT